MRRSILTEGVLQLCKFALVGCINTFIDWAVYFAIFRLCPGESILFYSVAKGFSYLCGIVNSFLLNRCWTFKTPSGEEGSRFLKFTLVNAVGLGINSASIYALLYLNTTHFLALFLTTTITFAFNFTLSKLWVFRKGEVAAKITRG